MIKKLINNYRKKFKLEEDFTLKDHKDEWEVYNTLKNATDEKAANKLAKKVKEGKNDWNSHYDINLPKGTIITVNSLRYKKRSMYENFVKLELNHPDFIGTKFKTSPRINLTIKEREFDQLNEMELTIMDD